MLIHSSLCLASWDCITNLVYLKNGHSSALLDGVLPSEIRLALNSLGQVSYEEIMRAEVNSHISFTLYQNDRFSRFPNRIFMGFEKNGSGDIVLKIKSITNSNQITRVPLNALLTFYAQSLEGLEEILFATRGDLVFYQNRENISETMAVYGGVFERLDHNLRLVFKDQLDTTLSPLVTDLWVISQREAMPINVGRDIAEFYFHQTAQILEHLRLRIREVQEARLSMDEVRELDLLAELNFVRAEFEEFKEIIHTRYRRNLEVNHSNLEIYLDQVLWEQLDNYIQGIHQHIRL